MMDKLKKAMAKSLAGDEPDNEEIADAIGEVVDVIAGIADSLATIAESSKTLASVVSGGEVDVNIARDQRN